MSKQKRKPGKGNAKPIRMERLLLRAGALAAVGMAVAVVVWQVTTADDEGGRAVTLPSKPAEAFSLPTMSGGETTLAEHLGQHNVLLYFSEGIGCAPCFDQIVDLEEDWLRFEALDIEMVSIMVDPLDMLKAEAEERGITGTLASDVDKTVSNVYETMQASMHPGVKPGHSFVLVDKGGRIIWRWDWPGHGVPMYVEVDELYDDVSGALARAG